MSPPAIPSELRLFSPPGPEGEWELRGQGGVLPRPFPGSVLSPCLSLTEQQRHLLQQQEQQLQQLQQLLASPQLTPVTPLPPLCQKGLRGSGPAWGGRPAGKGAPGWEGETAPVGVRPGPYGSCEDKGHKGSSWGPLGAGEGML